MTPVLLLTALFLPFLLYPVEVVLPYPHIVEELAKAFLIYLIIKDVGITPDQRLSGSGRLVPRSLGEVGMDSPGAAENRQIIKYAILVGVFFALTEAVFYIFNIVKVGGFDTFIIRLLITIPFHALTCLMIVLPTLRKKIYIIFGLLAAITTHYLYNLLMAQLTLL